MLMEDMEVMVELKELVSWMLGRLDMFLNMDLHFSA